MKRVRAIAGVVLFLTVLALFLSAVAYPLVRPGDQSTFRNVDGFYALKEDTLDAVYIGSSRVYAFWNPLVAFSRNGIAIYNFATAGQPVAAARFMIEEARKTQPHAVMIVNLETDKEESYASRHRITDRMPFSLTKLKLIRRLCERGGVRILDRFEYLFPMIRYHSRWRELDADDFLYDPRAYMSASGYDSFLTVGRDVTEKYLPATEEAAGPDDETREMLDELIDYCAAENVPLIFTLAPQAGVNARQLADRTGVRNYVRSRGVTVYDFQNCLGEIGLDLTRDYVDNRHTNVHGSAKFTAYLADILQESCGFSDKRGQKGYEAWEKAVDAYHRLADPYFLPFEWEQDGNADIGGTELSVSLMSGGVQLSLSSVAGSDGCTLFRKTGPKEPWTLLGEAADGGFMDKEGKSGYYYLAAPFTESDGVRYYGTVDYRGKRAE